MTPPRSMSPMITTGTFGGARETHIGDVVAAQIDLGRAAGAFDQHQIGLGLQALEALEHMAAAASASCPVFGGLGGAVHLALHDDLRADLALRLQQHRVHVHARRARPRRAPAAPGRGRSRRRRAATAALFDMFCGLNGRTRSPRLVKARASPATISDLPTSEPVPWNMMRARTSPSELDAGLRLHAGGEVVLDQRHLGDEIGGGDRAPAWRCGR